MAEDIECGLIASTTSNAVLVSCEVIVERHLKLGNLNKQAKTAFLVIPMTSTSKWRRLHHMLILAIMGVVDID